jgi:hypothetical protein
MGVDCSSFLFSPHGQKTKSHRKEDFEEVLPTTLATTVITAELCVLCGGVEPRQWALPHRPPLLPAPII